MPVDVLASDTLKNDDYVILLDHSGSMLEKVPGDDAKGYERDPLKALKSGQALHAIAGVVESTIREGDYFALIRFGDQPITTESQSIRHPHERELIASRIKGLVFKDLHTDIPSAMQHAGQLITHIRSPDRRKIVVFITDGRLELSADSPYTDEKVRESVYEEMRRRIDLEQWKVILVGLGADTEIDNLRNSLGLTPANVLSLDLKEDIATRLRGAIDQVRDEEIKFTASVSGSVTSTQQSLQVRLAPRVLGGYSPEEVNINLSSSFRDPIKISFASGQSIVFPGMPGVFGQVLTRSLTLDPGRPVQVGVNVGFDGERPDDGILHGTFEFRFNEGSERFYPYTGRLDVVLSSWWDSFGTWALFAVVASMAAALLGYVAYRKTTVPEIRIQMTLAGAALGEPFMLRKNDSLTIANNDLSGRSVPAKGLEAGVAATVTYIGRRRFQVEAKDAEVWNEGKSVGTLRVGMEELFDLKDSNGRYLRDIAISTTGSSTSDPFGRHKDDSPF